MPDADYHIDKILDPSSWVLAAEGLMDSASLLEPKACKYFQSNDAEKKDSVRYLKTQLMLVGFAFENMFKALIVQKQRDALASEFRNKGKLPHVLKSHDLVDLAHKAGLTLSDEITKSFLVRLTRHSVWAGRYPVPISPSDIQAENVFGIQHPNLVCVATYIKQDWEISQSLFNLAKQIMEKRTMV